MAIAQPVNQSEAELISGSESTVVPQEHPTFGRWVEVLATNASGCDRTFGLLYRDISDFFLL